MTDEQIQIPNKFQISNIWNLGFVWDLFGICIWNIEIWEEWEEAGRFEFSLPAS